MGIPVQEIFGSGGMADAIFVDCAVNDTIHLISLRQPFYHPMTASFN
jgi:hypothetical protein